MHRLRRQRCTLSYAIGKKRLDESLLNNVRAHSSKNKQNKSVVNDRFLLVAGEWCFAGQTGCRPLAVPRPQGRHHRC
jgi:hypothetical protein